MSITYPLVLLATVLLAAVLFAARMLLSHLSERRASAEKVDREHRDFKRAERIRRRAFVEQQVERVVAVIPMMIGVATKGDALRAQLHDFIESLGSEQFFALFAQLTPEQQIRFIRIAESVGVAHRGTGPASTGSGKTEEATGSPS